MKRAVCLLSAGVLSAVLLAGCGSAGAAESSMLKTTAAEDAVPQLTAQVYEKEYKSENGALTLGKYQYTVPSMKETDGADNTCAAAFNREVADFVAEASDNWDEAMEDAQDFYENAGSAGWAQSGEWTDQISYTANQSDLMINIRYDHFVYSGGAHGYTYYTSRMFAVKEECAVTLDEMVENEDGLRQAVAAEICRQIEAEDLAAQYGYWSDYASYVNDWMEDHSVYFQPEADGRGMEVTFPAYELASYAAGPQIFVIDPSVYSSYLNDYGRLLLGLDSES